MTSASSRLSCSRSGTISAAAPTCSHSVFHNVASYPRQDSVVLRTDAGPDCLAISAETVRRSLSRMTPSRQASTCGIAATTEAENKPETDARRSR